jgi:hypothetical protein
VSKGNPLKRFLRARLVAFPQLIYDAPDKKVLLSSVTLADATARRYGRERLPSKSTLIGSIVVYPSSNSR